MASGQDHDKATRLFSLPFSLFIGLLLDWKSGVIAGLFFLFGGLWLSPDLDTRSKALKRWGIFQGLWWPYRKLMPHRSVFSHGPIIGTILRMTYLMGLICLILCLLNPLGLSSPSLAIKSISQIIQKYPHQALAMILGLEASVWLHLIKDGDPLPTEWRYWRRR